MDESGIPSDHRSPRVLTKRGHKKVRYATSGNKSQITIVGCINAIGQVLPPFVIFDAKNLKLEWAEGEVPGTTYGLSDSGWMEMHLFKHWLIKHFLPKVGSGRPILLLLDGHSSHYNLEAVTFARKNDIILFTLVPHTTHEMQPLDTAVFGPLKSSWQDVCRDNIQAHPGRVITKYQFSHLFSKAWLKSLTPANISGFKSCRIYTFNSKAILDHNPCMSTKDVSSKNNLNGEGRSILQQDSGTQESSHHESSTNNSDVTYVIYS